MTSSTVLTLLAELEELTRAERVLYARRLEIIAELDRLDAAKQTGYTRLPALLAEVMHIRRGRASRMVAQAAQITETLTPTGHVTPAPLPVLREAVRAGLVDNEHLDEVTHAMKDLPVTVSVTDRELVETTLVATATSADPLVVRKHAEMLVARLDQEGHEPRHDEKLAQPKNTFTYRRTRDGGMDFRGHVEKEIAEVLENLLGIWGKPVADDPRPRHQRQGDALSDLIDAAANSTGMAAKPQLAVYLDLNVLTDAVGTATLESGTPIAASAARRLACDADIIPIVLNGDSVPLDLGRTHRLVKPEQRKALIARDKGCAYPDCTIPASWCDAHHIHHWLHGGPTDLANLVLLCRRHHRVLHHSPWLVRVNPGTGVPEFVPPTWIDPDQVPRRNTLRH